MKKKFIAVILVITLVFGSVHTVYAANLLVELWNNLKDLIEELIEQVPDEEFSVMEKVLNRTDTVYEGDDNPTGKVWWNQDGKDDAGSSYEVTNWAIMEGLYTTLALSPSIKAQIDDDIKKIEDQLEIAAKNHDFAPYKELFKALAMCRHTCGDVDVFDMEDSSLNTSGGKPSTSQSIEMAATLFADCLKEAKYPNPFEPEGLKALLQAFEFEDTSYIDFCKNKYSLENSQNFAKGKCSGKERTEQSDIKLYGRYDYHDQKFPDKVLQFYSCVTFDMEVGNGSQAEIDLFNECVAGWGPEVTEGRKKVLQKAASLYGKIVYSMDMRGSPGWGSPRYLDCSSYVGWSYHSAGFSDVGYSWCTGDFLSGGAFHRINADKLIPGDVALINTVGAGGSNHIGIYVGKSSSGQRIWIHCNGGDDRISVNTVNYWGIFMRYNKF